MKFAAEFNGVGANHFRKIIEPLKSIAHLIQLVRIRSESEAIEADAFHSLGLRREGHNSRRSRPRHETLRRESHAHTAHRFAEIDSIAQIAEVKFIYGRRAKRIRVTQAEQLRASEIQRIESRNIRAALRH